MKKIVLNFKLYIFGIFVILMQSCNTQYRVWVGENKEQKIFNLAYGENKHQKMDIFLPSDYKKSNPPVIIVHGGAWKRGSKEHMIMIQKYLHRKSIPTININYRLVKKGITYKDQLDDIEASIKKFNEYSGKTQLPKDQFIILGESSGAHLALLYGYEHPEIIQKIISLSGPTDFYSEQFLNSTYSRYVLFTIEDVVGAKYDRNNVPNEFREASPIYKVSNVPTLHFQGDSDLLVSRKQGIALDSVLKEKNIEHRFIYMKNTGHTPRFFSKKKREKLILPAILEWIRK